MTHPQHHRDDGGNPEIGRLVDHAYRTPVDVETASRHLWRLHQVAASRQVRGARRTLVSALAAVLLFATTGTAVALSGQALPGDSLYPVKRSAERLHLLVSFAPESDARLHLRFARSRVAEAEQVAAARPESVPALLSEIVDSVDRAREVGGHDLSDEVELVRHEASVALSSLSAALDTELAQSLGDTIRALDGEAVAAGDPGEPATGGDPAAAGDDPAAAGDDPGGDGAEPPGTGGDAEASEPGGEPAGRSSPEATGSDPAAARTPAPDRATPAPDTREPGGGVEEDPDGTEAGGTEAGGTEAGGTEAGTPETGSEAGPAGEPSQAPRPAAQPDAAVVAADGTMPRLERLEGLLRDP